MPRQRGQHPSEGGRGGGDGRSGSKHLMRNETDSPPPGVMQCRRMRLATIMRWMCERGLVLYAKLAGVRCVQIVRCCLLPTTAAQGERCMHKCCATYSSVCYKVLTCHKRALAQRQRMRRAEEQRAGEKRGIHNWGGGGGVAQTSQQGTDAALCKPLCTEVFHVSCRCLCNQGNAFACGR